MGHLSFLMNSYALFLLSSLLLLQCDLYAYAKDIQTHHVIDVESLFSQATNCSSSYQDLTSSSLKLVHRHGPCAPSRPKTKKLTHLDILTQDDTRVSWLQTKRAKKQKPNLASKKIPASSGQPFNTGNYIVTLSFGTPKVAQSVIFDTGSDVTWIQCQPCVSSCYTQSQTIFDPSKSSTYKNISCSSPFCAALDTSGCNGPTCLYAVQYGDQSYTVGFFAQETLTLTQTDVIPNFRFGCGEKNNGLFGTAAGLVGLGRQSTSLVSQTAARFGGVFSYCIPGSQRTTGFLNFGRSTASNVQYTPMLSDSSQPSFYYLSLLDIAVAGQKLGISPTTFSAGGVIIDSGTVITRLPPTAYTALKTQFKKLMTKYTLTSGASILDTCYDFSKETTLTVPTVSLVFSGTTMTMDFSGIFYGISATQTCLAFAANGDDSDLGIIGNTQQRRFGVVYDVGRKMVGFAAGAC